MSFALVALASTVAAGPVQAQELLDGQRLGVAFHVGTAVPAGYFKHFFDAGPGADVRLSYQLSPTTAIVGSGGIDFLRGRRPLPTAPVRTPNIRALHYNAGLEFQPLSPEPEISPVSLTLYAGIGATAFDSDGFQPLPSSAETTFGQTSMALTGGAQVGYSLDRITLVGGGQWRWSRIDENDDFIRSISIGTFEPFSSAQIFRWHVGARTQL